VSKAFRTIKKSAAKSSVSRKTLRSAVKKTSSAAKKGTWAATKKSGTGAKKGGSVAKKGAGKKASKNGAVHGHVVETKTALIHRYLHQPSIIRPALSSGETSLRNAVGSKVR
jgi:hypothetical protein